ncbi:hypothetical protein [Stenotrophomonas sp. GZD-301]|uniref:hypothetical protein n=1 Tax=Stenotrophomonas sp. GZD-301 TaxID=3404814 RepID=UPI003BB568E5
MTLALALWSAGASWGASASPVIYDPASRSVTNWSTEMAVHLDAGAVDIAKHRSLRCVKLNNYWCLKDMGWRGRVGRDLDAHTAFADGYFAARAAVRNMRTAYVKHGRSSALQIMQAYAPSDDCVGSTAGRRADGTCKWGYNPTEKYALLVSKGVADAANSDLRLFDSSGKANEAALVRFLQNMSAFETGGLVVKADTIRRGICLEDETCMPEPR